MRDMTVPICDLLCGYKSKVTTDSFTSFLLRQRQALTVSQTWLNLLMGPKMRWKMRESSQMFQNTKILVCLGGVDFKNNCKEKRNYALTYFLVY